jgi:hypothetical protein
VNTLHFFSVLNLTFRQQASLRLCH